MPRLKVIEPAEATGKAKELLEGVAKKMGMTPNFIRVVANSPTALQAYLGFSGGLAGGALSPRLREQIALTVGEANACEYCLAAHTALGKMAGLSDQEVRDSREANSADGKSRAALRFAKAVVDKRGFVSDEELAQVRRAGFGDAEVVEIVAVVALNIFTNYLNHVAQPEVDFPRAKALSQPMTSACACS